MIDVVVIGGGAAGLATAISIRNHAPDAHVVVLEGARTPGAKILVSGGSRCNVTNTVVTERDFNGGSPATIRRVLRAYPAARAATFFRDLGVPLHEEAGGKLFPDSGRARDVLDALLERLSAVGAELRRGVRVHDVAPPPPASAPAEAERGFTLSTSEGTLHARLVVLATGGLSLPKTGSDGAGYGFARRLGHSIVPTSPALVPLVLGTGRGGIHHGLSGVSLPVRLRLTTSHGPARDVSGALLWTHFGVSGPAPLDMSRHWLRARDEDHAPALTAQLVPSQTFETLEDIWITWIGTSPRSTVLHVLGGMLPASVASAVLDDLAIDGRRMLATFTRETRRALVHALLAWPLPVADSRGYRYAEVTAGGLDLAEIDATSMASRRCPGLYAVGEVLDVDGRLGGFNFQWAWSSAHVAGTAIARRLREAGRR